MLLTISCTRPDDATWPAADLGYLLHKNPAHVQAFEQSYGVAHVLYPEATDERCTAALLLEIDPVRLVRGKTKGAGEFSLGQYVNDRPYAASSLLAVAIAGVFGSALHGRCRQRPELAETALPLRIDLPAVPCKAGPEAAERVFAPLGWTVAATPLPLDPAFPDWGDSHYIRLELTGALRLSEALSHLYVLLPALDGSKHYFQSTDEIDKLLRVAEHWLPTHPDRTWITRRYLTRRHSLVQEALARLAELDDLNPEEFGAVAFDEDHPGTADARAGADATGDLGVRAGTADSTGPVCGGTEFSGPNSTAAALADGVHGTPTSARVDGSAHNADGLTASGRDHAAETSTANTTGEGEARRPSLAVERREAVRRALRAVGASRVLDLGCGQGALLRELIDDRAFTEIVGVDVSVLTLRIAQRRLARVPQWQSRRVTLRQGALTYTDASLRGYDAAVLMEVIEHVDPPRLDALEHAVFGAAAPGAVIVTTPNGEYNVLYEGMEPGAFRHADHRFEWSRAEFADWAQRVSEKYGYTVRFEPVGPVDAALGASTQLAVFTRRTHDEGSTAHGESATPVRESTGEARPPATELRATGARDVDSAPIMSEPTAGTEIGGDGSAPRGAEARTGTLVGDSEVEGGL
ncbi:3' terminal RNA ribose 2'-O-methyltransferase Hen1 [Nocardia jejuensis]|uniref:3' terminal RNA ribose 2'-O-methyltransferase Hen1 n=1 Tax=Nocardia jejuensis TaxID=328049 RepID=UPI000A483424|nr:3' terminal RNA ribose 2'-O-methyltransferase Hen1 [Nocardia jejuensis]